MNPTPDARAFPTLDPEEMAFLREMAMEQTFTDGQTLFRAGDSNIDFFVVKTGQLDILNPGDNYNLIVSHHDNQFVGDIDLLTQRPVLVTARSNGTTTVLRIPGEKLRTLINTVPKISDKLLRAFFVRRELLSQSGTVGMRVVGPGYCGDTNRAREFLYKNFVPFVWHDTQTQEGRDALVAMNVGTKTPLVRCNDGSVLINPTLRELARCAGVLSDCPQEEFDLAIIGAGPGGLAAAVYAASEGIRTIVLDRLGPGGQAGGSSKVENFIGFPSGISGADLATRAVLQMMKFGAKLFTPVDVKEIIPAETDDQPLQLKLDCGTTIRAQVVLIATGVTWRKLTVPGAQRFERTGIYYACTAIEARMHNGTEVAVVGAGNSAGQAAMFLAENCATTVHMLVRRGDLAQSMSDYLAHRILSTHNIEVHFFSEVTEVIGKQGIESIEIVNNKTSEKSRLNCTAVFTFIGAEPQVGWLPDSIAKDELGYLLTGVEVAKSGRWPLKHRDPCPLETTMPRVLAGGDVRAGSTKRVGFAVGDGSFAVTCVHSLRTIRA